MFGKCFEVEASFPQVATLSIYCCGSIFVLFTPCHFFKLSFLLIEYFDEGCFTRIFGWEIPKFCFNAENSPINNDIRITIDIGTSLLGLGADSAALWLGPLRLGRSDRLACLSFSKVLFLCRLSLCLTRNVLLSFLGIQIIVSCTPALLEGQVCVWVFCSGSEPMTPVPAGPANYHKIWADNKPSVIISTLQLLFFCSD